MKNEGSLPTYFISIHFHHHHVFIIYHPTSSAIVNCLSDEDIPEWERELQQELQDYDMMDDGTVEDADIESEILKQLEQEDELGAVASP